MIIGIDNGLDGGLAAISKTTGALIDKTIMPTQHRAGKREVDTRKLYDWIMSLGQCADDFLVAVEEPLKHAKSSQAVRSMGISFGKIVGLCESRQWNHCCVSVHKWQKKMLGNIPKGQTKEAALWKAECLAPDECWQKSKRASKAHDGMVDAFLIARYIKDKHNYDNSV
tara:strand:+ start:693 stop:1199 length:507 start_codon:yes stop_codon:yes gene_type:complete